MNDVQKMREADEGRRVAMRLRGQASCWNLSNKPIHVRHNTLRSVSGRAFRKYCPVCKEGVLLVRRNGNTFETEEVDYCICCGQYFIYDDIEEMRKKDRARYKSGG